MGSDARPLAILCGDIHASHKPPVARSGEPDWYAVMARQYQELSDLSCSWGGSDPVPIICSGDVFDKWSSPPSLINHLIEHLPTMYAIPGQHDLPNHRLDGVDESAYGTLVRAGTLIDLTGPLDIDGMWVEPFPWGADLIPGPAPSKDYYQLRLAVCHKYIWQNKATSYPGADKAAKVSAYSDFLQHYTYGHFGDNHIPFNAKAAGGCVVVNCGGFMRRRIDEISHKPRVALIYPGATCWHYLDCVKDDIFVEPKRAAGDISDISGLVTAMTDAADNQMDFVQALRRRVDQDAPPATQQVITDIFEEVL